MTIARIMLASLVCLAACKDKKQEPKPTPAEVKPAEPAPEAPKPAEAKPTEPPPAEAKPAEAKPLDIKPAGGFNTQAEYEAKANDLVDQLVTAVGQAGTNCDKLAAGLNHFADTNKGAIDGANAFKKANPEAEKQLTEKMKARQLEIAQKLGPAMQACQKHKGVQAAMTRLQ